MKDIRCRCGALLFRAAGGAISGTVEIKCRPQQGRYRIQAEYVVWGTNGPRPLTGGTAPGVFRMPKPRLKHHIAGKPVELMEGLLGPVDGPVLDPFMGSRTIGVACARRGIDYVGIEVERPYFEIAGNRLKEAG